MSYEDPEAQIAQLQATIAQQESEIIGLEGEILLLKEELREFTEEYDRVVKPAANRLQAAKSALKALEDLQLQRQLGQLKPLESLWRDARTPDDTEKSASESPPEEDILPSATRPDKRDSGRLKALYHTLARRFHPDTATDDAERAICNRMMTFINTAYAEKDLETLRMLAAQFTGAKNAISRQVSLVMLQLWRFRQQTDQLAERIHELQAERASLRFGMMIDLKTRVTLARFKGEDLLQRIADEMDAEYWDLSAKIILLRQQIESTE